MAEVLGPMQLAQLGISTGLDATEIVNWQLKEGRSFGAVISDLQLAIGAANEGFVRDWGWLFSITNNLFAEYPTGGSVTAAEEITELSQIDDIHGTTLGHMLPLKLYGKGIGGSWKYFQRTRESKVMADIATAINPMIWRFEQVLLTRALTNTENAIGSAGYDVPFVRGTGGTVDFAPMPYGGEAFTTSHDHFIGVDSGSKDRDDVLNEMAETLQEHGHEPPYIAVVPRADVAAYRALTDFVQMITADVTLVDRAGATSGAQYFSRGMQQFTPTGKFGSYQSNFGEVELRATSRVPTAYAGMYKSYGQLDPRNSLSVRVAEEGFGINIVVETTDDRQWPVKSVKFVFEFGVGVGNDRTNGAAAYLVSGGAWSNPTIS